MMKINNLNLLKKIENDTKKITIAIFSDCYYPLVGGITTRVYNQAKELSKYANVIVLTGEVGKYSDPEDLPFVVVRCKGLKLSEYQGHLALPFLDSKFKNFLKAIKIDVIHSHTYFSMAKCAHWLSKKHNIPLIQITHQRLYPEYLTIVHSRLIAKILTSYSIKMIKKADEAWTVSQNVVDFYHSCGLNIPFKIDPSGTDKSYPQSASEVVDLVNKKYNLTDIKNLLICYGRVEAKQKNLYFLIDACKILKQKNFNFKLVLAGKGKDLSLLQKYVKEQCLENEVLFTGFTSKEGLDGLLIRSDLLLFPSLNDNFGLTKVEAACLGTPTLGLKDTAVVEGIQDNVNGFISDRNCEAYANRIIEILNNKSNLQIVSNNAKNDLGKSWSDTSLITYNMTMEFLKKREMK